jgi:hypothetical protein
MKVELCGSCEFAPFIGGSICDHCMNLKEEEDKMGIVESKPNFNVDAFKEGEALRIETGVNDSLFGYEDIPSGVNRQVDCLVVDVDPLYIKVAFIDNKRRADYARVTIEQVENGDYDIYKVNKRGD